MKPKYFVLAAVFLVVAATFLQRKNTPEVPPAPEATITTTTTAGGMTLTKNTDPTLVFQKAFWRHPTGDDKILHAERREWSAEDGVQKWDWFIAVSPGPQLLEWLNTNPFSMVAAPSAAALENRPEWFPQPSAEFQIQQNAHGNFTLMLSADRKHLYASDSGLGFTPPGVAP